MSRFGVTARRSLGQHFMTDPGTARRIASLSGAGAGDHVVEIGAGLGSLTLALIETGASVLAVETDRGLIPALRHVIAEATDGMRSDRADTRVRIVQGDARSIDFSNLLSAADQWHLAANLPYNIATSLVVDLLYDVAAIKTMVVVLQRETAERLAAPPSSRARGIPSVLIERHGTARVLDTLPPSVFTPRPAVESAILRIERRSSLPGVEPRSERTRASPGTGSGSLDDRSGPANQLDQLAAMEDRLEQLLRTAFGQRRKMLRRSLVGIVEPAAFAGAGVDPSARPETLTFRQWSELATASQPTLRPVAGDG